MIKTIYGLILLSFIILLAKLEVFDLQDGSLFVTVRLVTADSFNQKSDLKLYSF
jgi:hypothetical protein